MVLLLDEELRILPKKRKIPETKPKSFILFPFELHEKLRESFEIKEEESLRLIKNHLKTFKKAYVASSHGKDSIIMVHLIKRTCKELGIPMIEVWLNNTLNIYKEERNYWNKINKFLEIEDNFREFYPPKDKKGKPYTVWSIAKEKGHLPSFRRTAKQNKSYKQTQTPYCCKILKKDSIKQFLKSLSKEERFDCAFVGTRAEESQIRSLGVLQRCRSYTMKYRVSYPIRIVTPLSFWKYQDILEYFDRYDIPKNPVYKIHNIERMGCASCPAHKNWEIRLAQDPTEEGFGMLKLNLKILKNTESFRFEESIKTLKKYIESKKSESEINDSQRRKIILLIKEFSNFNTLEDYLHA